jgi:iron(III) transport system permease protein
MDDSLSIKDVRRDVPPTDDHKAGRLKSLLGRFEGYDLFVQAVMALVVFLVLFPLLVMLSRTFVVKGALSFTPFRVLTEPWFLEMLSNTAIAVGVSTVLSVAFGASLAWLNERTDAHLGIVGTVLPMVPLVIPGVALAIGWVFLAAPRVGFLNAALASLPLIGRGGLNLQLNVYSWGGLIWLYFIHGVPYAYLLASAAFHSMDPALEEASRISGAGILRTLRRVSLPAAKPALIASSLLVVITGLGTYSIPVIAATTANIDLLSLRLVRMLRNIYPPQLAEAQVLGMIMLVVVGVLWFVQKRVARDGLHVTTGGKATGSSRLPLGRWRGTARAVMIVYMALTSVIPLVALLIVALQPFWTPRINPALFTLDNFREMLITNQMTVMAFRNSVLLSAVTATAAMTIAVVAAIQLARRSGLQAQFVDGVIKLPATVPNLVMALGFLVTFTPAPFNLSGTLILLLLAYVIIHMPPGSIAANAAVAQIGKDIREASYISGASEARTVWRIVLPLALPGFAAGWTLVFVHTVGDLNASALLAGPNNPVVGFAILSIWEGATGVGVLAAFSTLMCLIIGSVVVLTAWFVNRRTRRA